MAVEERHLWPISSYSNSQLSDPRGTVERAKYPGRPYSWSWELGTAKTGYFICFKDSKLAETACNNTEWLSELGNDTKLVKSRFGVAAHRTPTGKFATLRIWFDSAEAAQVITAF
jgi:hypothetical protein